MALMAALEDGLPADDATEPSDIGAFIDSSSAAVGQMYDPAVLSNVQGFLASALGRAAPSASSSGLPGAAGQGGDGLVGSSRVAWAQDPMGDGLVAQTAALDGLGDIKDGDTAAGLLAQGRPTLVARGTTSFAQRSEALSA
ncbi:MAG: hypothetical protein O9331_18020, partial [Acidovorax sp.]|nr:hypothetical protein [Acidovorax sp.]